MLVSEGKITDAYQKESKGRTMTFIVQETNWRDDKTGEPVVTARFNLIHRAREQEGRHDIGDELDHWLTAAEWLAVLRIGLGLWWFESFRHKDKAAWFKRAPASRGANR